MPELYRLVSESGDKLSSRVPLSVYVSGFSEVTTVHGIPHVARSQGPVKRICWVILGVVACLALIGHIIIITRLYLSYDVNVDISLKHKPELEFPAVTLCNMSPVRRSLWNAALETGSLYNRAENASQGQPQRSKRSTSVCPDRWLEFSVGDVTSCYFISGHYQIREAAQTECADMGSTLASILSQEEQDFIISSADLRYEYWLGLTKDAAGVWGWDDGGGVGYTNWAASFPLSAASWSCVYLTRAGLWQNLACSSQLKFICKLGDVTLDTTTSLFIIHSPDMTSSSDLAVSSTEEPVVSQRLVLPPNDTCDCPCCTAADDLMQITVQPVTPDPLEAAVPGRMEGSEYPERAALREDYTRGEELLETLASLRAGRGGGEGAARRLGYTIQDLILDCQYAGSTCTLSRDFVEFYNPVHGNCFTFNSGWVKNVTKSKRPGKRHGLELTLNIEQDDYVTQTGDTAGMRIVIHPHNRMSFPEDEGMTLPPGRSTYVGVRQVEIKRLAGNYGNCRDPDVRNYQSNVYEEYFNVRYSLMACLKTCHQRHVISRCACADVYFPSEGAAFGDPDVEICSTTNITQSDCLYGIRREFARNEVSCDCPNPCRDVLYETTVSSGTWPSDVQKTHLLSRLATKIPWLLNDTSDPEKFRRNLLKTVIYFEEFNYEQIEEKIDYPPSQFASDLGGVLGLWFGVSIFTVVEFLELVSDLLVIAHRNRKLKNATTPDGEKGKYRKREPRPDRKVIKSHNRVTSGSNNDGVTSGSNNGGVTSGKEGTQNRKEKKEKRRREKLERTGNHGNQENGSAEKTPVIEFKY